MLSLKKDVAAAFERAKQHVLRVPLVGQNSAMHPWRLPPLTAELRAMRRAMRRAHNVRIGNQFPARLEQDVVLRHLLGGP